MATLQEKRGELWDVLCDAEVGSEEWQSVYKAIEALDELERRKAESAAKLKNESKKLTLEERKIHFENAAALEHNRTEKKSLWVKIVTSILGLGATAGIAIMTVKDEETRAITSKVDQKAKDLVRFIKS